MVQNFNCHRRLEDKGIMSMLDSHTKPIEVSCVEVQNCQSRCQTCQSTQSARLCRSSTTCNCWSDHTFLSKRSQVGLCRARIVSRQNSRKGVLTKIEVCHTLTSVKEKNFAHKSITHKPVMRQSITHQSITFYPIVIKYSPKHYDQS